jgi:hypothetical protein
MAFGGQEFAKPLAIPPPIERFELGSPLPGISGVMLDNYNDGMGLAQQAARSKGLQARILWIDGTANLGRVNSTEKIGALMAKVASVGFNTVVFDIKPISGQVLYKSEIAPKIREWRGQTLPEDFDPVPDMVSQAHKNHLQIFVSMNAFSEGHSMFKVGPGYDALEHQSVLYDAVPVVVAPDGASYPVSAKPSSDGSSLVLSAKGAEGTHVSASGVVLSSAAGAAYTLGGDSPFLTQHVHVGDRLMISSRANFVRTSEHTDQYPLMMNPNDPAVQDRALSIVREVVSKYGVDGILYDDRLRYAGLNADFSDISKQAFEKYVGQPLSWPTDVFTFTYNWQMKKGIKPGRFYDAWMLWRTLQMRNWVARVRNAVKQTRSSALFGIYGGSWFGDYPAFGSNYGSPNLEAGFWFLTPQYQKTGFAPLLDLIITGCYYQTATEYEAMVQGKPIGSTVESAGQLTNRVVDDQCWAYAGIELEDFKGNPDGLANALQAACSATQGVMVFDLSHDIESSWSVFARAFKFKATAPHAVPGLLGQVRNMRKRYQTLNMRERPVVISAGSSGAGF